MRAARARGEDARNGEGQRMPAKKSAATRAPVHPSNPVDAFLAKLPAGQRAALAKLRAQLRAAAPKAVEDFGYRLPMLRLDGRALVYYGAAAKHCALYPGSMSVTKAFAQELAGFKTTTGAIQFQPERPLPAPLVRRIVKYRIAEEAAARARRR